MRIICSMQKFLAGTANDFLWFHSAVAKRDVGRNGTLSPVLFKSGSCRWNLWTHENESFPALAGIQAEFGQTLCKLPPCISRGWFTAGWMGSLSIPASPAQHCPCLPVSRWMSVWAAHHRGSASFQPSVPQEEEVLLPLPKQLLSWFASGWLFRSWEPQSCRIKFFRCFYTCPFGAKLSC